MKHVLLTLVIALLAAEASGQPAIQWQKVLGGNSIEEAYATKKTTDGGFIVAGVAFSFNNGDVSGGYGNGDFWIVKLDPNGEIQWQKALGGTSTEIAYDIRQTLDGGFIAVGSAFSNDGDLSENQGSADCWIVKLDQSGTIEWQKTLGGSNTDEALAVQQVGNGGYIITGYSLSNDGDVSENYGSTDVWVIKTDGSANIQWQKTLGGFKAEWANAVEQTADNGYIIVGKSESIDGDLSENHGELDFWIVKLAPESTPTTEASNITPLEIYPNPAHNTITLQTTAHEPNLQITITDMLGRTMQHPTSQNGKNMNVSTLATGMYIITATAPSGKTYSGTFKKE